LKRPCPLVGGCPHSVEDYDASDAATRNGLHEGFLLGLMMYLCLFGASVRALRLRPTESDQKVLAPVWDAAIALRFGQFAATGTA